MPTIPIKTGWFYKGKWYDRLHVLEKQIEDDRAEAFLKILREAGVHSSTHIPVVEAILAQRKELAEILLTDIQETESDWQEMD